MIDASNKNPFGEALDLLDRINNLEYQGTKLRDLTITGGYNVWVFNQNRIFFNDLKRVVEGRAENKPMSLSVKDWILGLTSLAISIAAILWQALLRPSVVIYSIDRDNSSVANNDARMNGIYWFLKKNRISYIEYFHAILDRTLFKRFGRRGRLALYMRSIDFGFMLLRGIGLYTEKSAGVDLVDFSTFSVDERAFVKPIVEKYLNGIPLIKFRIKVLQRILVLTRPKVILSIDNPRDYNELVVAAKHVGAPFLAFQHGHFTKYHVGWLKRNLTGLIPHPDRLYVWSDFWKQELLRLGTYFKESEIVVGGTAASKILETDSHPKSDIVSVLVPYETDGIKSEIKRYIELFLNAGFKVYFKLRTDQSQEDQLKLSLLEGFRHENLILIKDFAPVIAEIDVVAGTYSTFLYDMVAYRKPVALLETANDFGNGMVENGLADMVNREDAIEEIRRIANTNKEVLQSRFEKLFDKEPKSLEDTLQLVAKEYNLI